MLFTRSLPAVVSGRQYNVHGALEGQFSGQDVLLKPMYSERRNTNITHGAGGGHEEMLTHRPLMGTLAACGSS